LDQRSAYNEPDILKRMAAGDQGAFAQLFDRYRTQLFQFTFEMTKSAADAEDIVQEIFAKIWINRERIATLGHASSYIYTMTRNHTFDVLRKIARDEASIRRNWNNMQNGSADGESLLREKENAEILRQALALVPEIKQRIFYMSREEGLSHSQIACELGLSRSRIKNIIVEMHRFIREYLSRYAVSTLLLLWYW